MTENQNIAKIFKALGDETRLAVLKLLQSGEKCACVLLDRVFVGQSTLSHHMKILVESGLVTARKNGKWTYYAINPIEGEKACQILRDLTVKLDDGVDYNACCRDDRED
ncbi:MAG: metalloregulator ArsR/SmtB family transcription factor [Deltaproteobacteria bacterium]|jgi:ArsR family transcriptional regulator|nr:metalloregulator ArsR/SmtB family transcription factor [Deltaproteobacteria bacterium]